MSARDKGPHEAVFGEIGIRVKTEGETGFELAPNQIASHAWPVLKRRMVADPQFQRAALVVQVEKCGGRPRFRLLSRQPLEHIS